MSSTTSLGPVAPSAEQRSYLDRLPRAEGDDPGIPIYLRDGDRFIFLPEYKMASAANRAFERDAPAGLYRGGAVILVTYQGGTLVVPDDRYGWYKPFAGIAQHDEGGDLTLAGIRELIEEAFLYDTKEKALRFVPQGAGTGCELLSSLGFTAKRTVEVGQVKLSHYAVNESNRSYEAVLTWDISGIGVTFSVSLEEEWWNKDKSGISVYVLNDDGTLRGVFSGQQGLIALPKLGIHPTLKSALHLA